MPRDTLDVFGVRYTDVVGIKATDNTSTVQRYVRPEGTLSITANNVYDVASYASVSVNVEGGSTINNQNKTVTPTESQQAITADSGYTGLGTVTVNAISSTYVGSGVSRQSGSTVTPTESAQNIVAADTYVTGQISVGAIDSNYVGSGVDRRSSSDLTASGATVTAPAGYYSSNASASVASGSATAPASISGTAATVSTGSNTLTLTKTISVTPSVTAGYVSSGTAGNSSVSLTANVTTKSAATITPGTSNQTIASGTYLTGTQTISGDSDLTAANIKTGVDIFGVTGTYTSDATAAAADILSGETAYVNGSKVTGSLVVQHYYTGTATPASSLGSNGDIYLKVSS